VSLVKDKLYVHTSLQDSSNKSDMLLTAFQLVSAVNYQAFEEKKEFPLLNGIDV